VLKDLCSATWPDDPSLWINGHMPSINVSPFHLPVDIDGYRPAMTHLGLTPARFQSLSSHPSIMDEWGLQGYLSAPWQMARKP
jgi:hypothetical protein